jgi:N-methylhydantoinase B
VIRIRTTGGGGWGDPLERDPDAVARDVLWGKVTRAAAADDYGVVVIGDQDEPALDVEATQARRDEIRATRPANSPFFDRGPGYARLSGGPTAADVDWI